MVVKILCIATLVFGALAIRANALICYDCNTATPGCSDPFNSTNIPTVNCSALYYSSRENEYGVRATSLEILTQDYSRASDGAQYECFAYHTTYPSNYTEVVRGCRIIENELCNTLINGTIGAPHNISSCLTCQEDYCNNVQMLNSTASLILLSVLLIFVYSKC